MRSRPVGPIIMLAAVLVATGCTSSGYTPLPATVTAVPTSVRSSVVTAPETAGMTTHTGQADLTTAAASTGADRATGTFSVEINGQESVEFEAGCTRTGDQVTAEGRTETASVNAVLTGSGPSVVYTMSTEGGTLIFQARRGLKDARGTTVGKLEVTSEGDTYSGTGIFVFTKMDAAGVDATPKAKNSRPGGFTLTCGEFARG